MRGGRVNFSIDDNTPKSAIGAGGTGTTRVLHTLEGDHSISMKGGNRMLGNNRLSTEYNYRFKVILLGDSKVGKSSIVRRIVDETFNLKYQETAYFDTV